MLIDYLPIVVLAALAVVFAVASLVVSSLVPAATARTP